MDDIMTAEPNTLWPEEIRLSKSKNSLFVKFENGYETTLSAELLRVGHHRLRFRDTGLGKKPRLW